MIFSLCYRQLFKKDNMTKIKCEFDSEIINCKINFSLGKQPSTGLKMYEVNYDGEDRTVEKQSDGICRIRTVSQKL